MRILLVEDDLDLSAVVARGLRRDGLAVDQAFDGNQAIELIDVNQYDVLVLDRQLPGVHGDDVCRHAIAQSSPPRVLMLTAAGNLDERVQGLEIGADDYLPKPFAMTELVARIRALARRPSAIQQPILTIGDIEIDSARHRASRAGRDLRLTPKEFGVMEVLANAAESVVSAEYLLEHVWDEQTDPFTNAVRITIMTLRRKLGEPQVIETVIGIGYRIMDPQ
jgi:DNA-binding response OmpR family regulator